VDQQRQRDWEDLSWSLGVRPGAGQTILITNGNWKAVQLKPATKEMKLYLNGALAVQTNTTIQPIGAYDPGWNPGIGIGTQAERLPILRSTV